MITLIVKNYCHNCPEFEPDVYKDTLYVNGEDINMTNIKCIHRQRCESIIEFLKLEKR